MLRRTPDTWRPNLFLRLSLFAEGAGLVVGSNRPLLALHGDTLTARGIFMRRVDPVGSVVDVGAARDGVLIEYADGSAFTPTFVGEKGLGLQLLGWRTAGDSIADRVMAAAARARREQREETAAEFVAQLRDVAATLLAEETTGAPRR